MLKDAVSVTHRSNTQQHRPIKPLANIGSMAVGFCLVIFNVDVLARRFVRVCVNVVEKTERRGYKSTNEREYQKRFSANKQANEQTHNCNINTYVQRT